MKPLPTPRDPNPATARWLLAETRTALLWHRLQAVVCVSFGMRALAAGRWGWARRDFREAVGHAVDAARCAAVIPLLKRAAGPNVGAGAVRITLHLDGRPDAPPGAGGTPDGHGQA